MSKKPKPGDKLQLGAMTVVVGCKHIVAAFPEGVLMPEDWGCWNCAQEEKLKRKDAVPKVDP